MFKNLCRAVNLENVAIDPQYATRKQRAEQRVKISETITRETKKYTSRELEAKLLAADVACGMVRNVGDIVQEPHVQARGILEEADYPSLGKIVAVKTPILLSGKPAPFRRRAPMLGENTKEILRELEYGDEEIQELIRKRVALQYEPK